MGRRELREQIFKLLFRVEFHEKEDMPEQLVLFLEEAEEQLQSIVESSFQLCLQLELSLQTAFGIAGLVFIYKFSHSPRFPCDYTTKQH